MTEILWLNVVQRTLISDQNTLILREYLDSLVLIPFIDMPRNRCNVWGIVVIEDEQL